MTECECDIAAVFGYGADKHLVGAVGLFGRMSILGLFASPDVQKELKLSGEQITKLRDAIGKLMYKYKDDFAKLEEDDPGGER